MNVYDIALKRRSIRRFKQKKVPFGILKKLVNAARLAPSSANLQPCEFIVVDDKETVNKIFPHLKWAGYLQPGGNPPEGKQPVAYIAIIINKKRNAKYAETDAAAAVESILLVACDEGLGSCWIGAIDKDEVQAILKAPEYCELKYVVALGYPDEKSQVEKVKDSIEYWRDKDGLFHVPKRCLEDVLSRNRYKQ